MFEGTPCWLLSPPGTGPGEDVGLALDVAASQFWRDGSYQLEGGLDSRSNGCAAGGTGPGAGP